MKYAAVLEIAFALICCALLTLPSTAQPTSSPDKVGDVSRWKTFASRAGWRVSYPAGWLVGSCRQCLDPTDPNAVFVTFSDPSTKEVVMIEHLIDKPRDQTVEQWMNDLKKTTVLNPAVSEEWILLDGRRALRVTNRNPDSTETESVYIVRGSTTLAIRARRSGSSYGLYRRMLSTFRLVGPSPADGSSAK